MRRRHVAAVALAVALNLGGAGAAEPPLIPLTIIEPYGPGSITDLTLEVLKPGLQQTTGQPVAVDHADEAGTGAVLARLAPLPPDGKTVLIIDLLSVEIADAVGNPQVKLASLTPVAKLTGPASVALVVPTGSPIRNWGDFAAAARDHPLKLAFPGRTNAVAVPVALMERALGTRFTDIVAPNRQAILAALADNSADAGFLVTDTLLPTANMPPPPVRPIVSFGAARHPKLAQLPTFKESIGTQPRDKRHNAITSTLALFGPGDLDRATVRHVGTDFALAARAAARNGSMAAAGLRFEFDDAAALRQTMARDTRVISEILDLLR